MSPRRVSRPEVDSVVDALLAERHSPSQHRLWWQAESAVLGGLTPIEALEAGCREELMDLAMGCPGMSEGAVLVSRERAEQILTRETPTGPGFRAAAALREKQGRDGDTMN